MEISGAVFTIYGSVNRAGEPRLITLLALMVYPKLCQEVKWVQAGKVMPQFRLTGDWVILLDAMVLLAMRTTSRFLGVGIRV
jgi:hypothetical protein